MKKTILLLASLSVLIPVYAQDFSGKFNADDVKTVCDAVNNWEIANFNTTKKTPDHWAMGAMYRGMFEWDELTENEAGFEFLKKVGKSINYRPGWKTYHADYTTVLQTWLKMYVKYGDVEMLRPAQERLFWVASHPSDAPLNKKDKIGKNDRWSWCDALFMAPPAYAQMYAISGEKVYLEYMENEFKECTDSLYDAKECLYYRDCGYIGKKEANGKKVFWGRGNGWVFAGIPLILNALPSDYQNADYFLDIFRDMAKRIVALQDKEGHWHASMLDPDSYPMPENSASAFFCYGLAWGLRTGVLKGAKYEKALEKGWAALISGVHNDGMPGYMQPIGASPKKAGYDSTEVYGAGGILLAGSEILRILGYVHPTSQNPHAFVTDETNAAMITSLKVIDPDRLLEMDFTADYKLDKLIDSNVDSFESFMDFVSASVFDVKPQNYDNQSLSVGCSAFAATEAGTGSYLMGRNYDYCHVEDGEEIPLTAMLVRTAPKGGKKSISMVDSYWLGLHKGFYSDGKTDLSMLMTVPYMVVDGINEDGFAVGALHLDGNGTWQTDAGKKPLWMFILMRKLLDSAGSVEEAIKIASEYNVILSIPTASGSLHFYVADASGDFAILEYSYAEGEDTATAHPNTLKVLRGQDCYRYVTNFYADPALSEHPTLGPLGKHGLARYETLKKAIDGSGHLLSAEEAMGLLKSVSQNSNPDENTSHTQWSSLYNLSEKKLDISILQEYDTKYTFRVDGGR